MVKNFEVLFCDFLMDWFRCGFLGLLGIEKFGN